jgi:ABC-2 type transport system permease protein
MLAIFRKEVNVFFSSFIAYIAIGVFLIATGLFVWILPGSNIFDFGYANLDELFNIGPWVFMFLIPAITMRFFAEENKTGTIEIIATKPVSDFEIVSGKYLAGLIIVVFSLVPTLLYFYTIHILAAPPGNVDVGAIWGSYLGLLFIGSAYISIGIFASALTDNQIVSFILAMFICFFFYILLDWLREYTMTNPIDPFLEFISIKNRYISISRGVLDTRDLIYFISFTLFFLSITKTLIERRKW